MREQSFGHKPVVAMIADYPRDADMIDGGVQAVTAYLVKELVKSGEIDLRLVSFDASVHSPIQVRNNGIVQFLLPRQRFGATTRWRQDFAGLLKCLKSINPAVLHAQGAGIDGYLAVKTALPAVVTFHGIIREDARYMSRFIERVRLSLQSMVTERYCALHAKHTILISPYVKEYYAETLRGTNHLIPNPVDGKFYDIQRREESGRILFAGRLIPRKGVIDLIEAFALVRGGTGARLVLAGALTDERYVRKLKQRIDELDIGPYVEFLGLLKEPELLVEFGRAAVLALPSYQETAPMVIQQAMAAGLPVVATRICGIPGQVDDGRTGFLFEPHDVRALARHLELIISQRTVREEMRRAARTKASAEYRADHVAGQTLGVYREMIGQTSRNQT